MNGRSIVLTISSGSASSRRIWNGRKPLPIGSSRRWFLERGNRGVLLRDAQGPAYGVGYAELEKGAKLEADGVSIHLKTAIQLPPAHGPEEAGPDPHHGHGEFQVYQRANGWTLQSRELGYRYEAQADGVCIFRITERDGEYLLTAFSPDSVQVCSPQSAHELRFNQALILTADELASIVIHSGVYAWTFNRPENQELLANHATPAWKNWQRELAGPFAVAATFFFAMLIWPEAKPELEPLQFVRITPEIQLSKPIPAKPSAMGSGATLVRVPEQRKAPPTATAAFQGNQLQSAMKGLFRGGMTQLLSRSEYSPGSDGSESARKLFQSKSAALHSTAPVTGPGIGSGTRIAALGGDGQGSGKGLGYGHGEHASVAGQGRSSVAMDTGGSSVEEGLTKDEVGKVIHRHMSEVRYCYEASILRTPDLEGKLVLGFTIGASGKVKAASVRSSSLTDSSLDDCVVRRLNAWKFPSTKGGIDVGVTYPFIFKTIGG